MQIGIRTNQFQTLNKHKIAPKNQIGFENRQIKSTIAAGLLSTEAMIPVIPVHLNTHSVHTVTQPSLPMTITVLPSEEHGHHGKNHHTHDDESGIDGPNGHSLAKNGKPPVNYIKSQELKRPGIGNENHDRILRPGEKPPAITMEY